MLTLSEALYTARQDKGYTLHELSKKTGISVVSLTKYEKNRGYPSVSSLWKLADTLGLDYGNLYAMLTNEKSKKERDYGN